MLYYRCFKCETAWQSEANPDEQLCLKCGPSGVVGINTGRIRLSNGNLLRMKKPVVVGTNKCEQHGKWTAICRDIVNEQWVQGLMGQGATKVDAKAELLRNVRMRWEENIADELNEFLAANFEEIPASNFQGIPA